MRAAWAAGLVGRRLGEFELVAPIGEGAFGVVFRAEQSLLQREAVVKVARAPGSGAAANRAVSRFLAEARLASRIDHPFAAHVYAFGAEPDGILWIAMELVRGTPLDRLLEEQGPMPVERAIPFLRRLCEVVHQAHEQGIVHRDLKPANVMVVSRAGTLFPKLLDLGVARDLHATVEERGNVIGTPLYMAPEQWVNAKEVTRAADIYALGAMSYEMLTGQPIFMGDTVQAIAGKHALATPPGLPGEFPEALSAAIRQSLAKQAADRFPTALAFSESMISTSGVTIDSYNLPGLDELTRDEVIMHGPQPIAEVIAAYEGARTPALARVTLWQAVRVISKYVALVALACRSRTGSGRLGDTPAVLELLAALRRGTLDEAQWWKLARELCRPFAAMPDVHPVPELVGLFFEQQAELRTPMDQLLEARASEPGVDATPEQLRGSLVAALPALAATLRSLRFLHDYKLVVSSEGRDEVWMGVRRPVRSATQVVRRTSLGGSIMQASVAGLPALRASMLSLDDVTLASGSHSPEEVLAPSTSTARGRRRAGPVSVQIAAVRDAAHDVDDGAAAEAMLVGSDGVVVVSLAPLIQVAPPSPGYPLELFLLDGHGRHGARLLSASERLERSDEGIWPRLGLGSIEADPSAVLASDDTPPYRGLATFTSEDTGRFFGREREVEGFVNRLATMPFIAIVGPSGAGKSSFVQAGVLPTLGPDWTSMVVRPGPTPLATLVTNLRARGIAIDQDALRESPGQLGVALRAHVAATGGSLLLVVDQFEELVTLCLDEREQEAYASALTTIAAEDAAVRVVITMRDDFLVRVALLPALRERLATCLQILTTPAPADLLRILTEPARRAGYSFEDDDLPREMVAEVASQPAALALLSFTAFQLWQFRDRHFKQLPRKAYLALGGVGGALAQHAEATLDAMAEPDRAVVREVFRHLVTAGGTRAVLSRAELLQVSGGPGAAGAIEQLIGARLLVAMDRGAGSESIEVAHEALISAWPRLVRWRQEDAEGARLRDQLRVAARQWDERGRGRGLLWRGEALAEYTLWRRRYPGSLTSVEEDFGRASIADAARGRRLRRGALIVVGTGLVIALVVFAGLRSQAERARASAERNRELAIASEAEVAKQLTLSFLERGRAAALAGDTSPSLLYLSEAMRRGVDGAGVRHMVMRGLDVLGEGVLTLRGHDGMVADVAYGPDGLHVASIASDGTARIWNVATGTVEHVLKGHDGGGSPRLAWSPDGASLVTGDGRGALRIWNAASGGLTNTLPGHTGGITAIEFSSDGKSLLSSSEDGTVRIWSLVAGTVQRQLDAPFEGADARAAFDTSSGRVVVVYNGWGTYPGHAAIWTPGGAGPVEMRGHLGYVWRAAIDPSGRWLASAGEDRTVRVWDAATGRQVRTMYGHDEGVTAVAWSKDGKSLVSAASDGDIKIWRPETGVMLASLRGHEGRVHHAEFVGADGTLLSLGADGTARLWDSARGVEVASYMHGGYVAAADVRRDDVQLATASSSGTIKLWSMTQRRLLRSLAGLSRDDPFFAQPSVSPDGTFLVRHFGAGVERWDLRDGAVQRISTPPVPWAPSTSRAGDRIAVADGNGNVRVFAADGGAIQTIAAASERLASAKLLGDGAALVTASAAGELAVWDTATGVKRASVSVPGIDDLVVAPGDGGLVAIVVTGDGRVEAHAFEVGTLAAQGKLSEGILGYVVGTSPGQVALMSVQASVDVWTLAAGSGPSRQVVALSAVPTALAFSPDGARLFVGQVDGTVRVFDARSGGLLSTIAAHGVSVFSIAISADGALAATAAADGEVKVWDLADNSPIQALHVAEGARWIGFVLGTRAIATSDGQTTDVWEASRFERDASTLAAILRCNLSQALRDGVIVDSERPDDCAN